MSLTTALLLLFLLCLFVLIGLIVLFIFDIRRDRQLSDMERKAELSDFRSDFDDD